MKTKKLLTTLFSTCLLLSLSACSGSSNDKKKSKAEKEREQRVANAEACGDEFAKDFKAINKTYQDGQRAYQQGKQDVAEKSIYTLREQCGEMLGKYDRSDFGCKVSVGNTTDVVDYDSFVQSCSDIGYSGPSSTN